MASSSVRKEELLKLVDHDPILIQAVEEMVLIEEEMSELKKLPFLKVHPDNPCKQKATPAAKLYRELLQQYTNLIRIMMKATGVDERDDDSPLRKWFKGNME